MLRFLFPGTDLVWDADRIIARFLKNYVPSGDSKVKG